MVAEGWSFAHHVRAADHTQYLQMLAAGVMMLVIGSYVIFGTLPTDGGQLPMLGGAFTLFSLIIIFLLTVLPPPTVAWESLTTSACAKARVWTRS